MNDDQLQEYEAQLADVEELLKVTPDDQSLLSLQSDLIELITITKQSLIATSTENSNSEDIPSGAAAASGVHESCHERWVGDDHDDAAGNIAPFASSGAAAGLESAAQSAVSGAIGVHDDELDNNGKRSAEDFSEEVAEFEGEGEEGGGDVAAGAASTEPPTKKPKKLKDFEVPKHLIALDTDTDAEKNRKRRALKALKSKWREKKKELESEKKKKSWQSFQKKAKIKEKSIFATNEGDSKVGVVTAGRKLTSFGERKRHTQN